MTDTGSGNDTGDVLNAIRRTVSVPPETTGGRAFAGESDMRKAGIEGPLVLTAAHRVPNLDSGESGESAAPATEAGFAEGEDPGVFDENALREIVIEAVRQELQGPSGERIIRNIRKFLRREIQAALAANRID